MKCFESNRSVISSSIWFRALWFSIILIWPVVVPFHISSQRMLIGPLLLRLRQTITKLFYLFLFLNWIQRNSDMWIQCEMINQLCMILRLFFLYCSCSWSRTPARQQKAAVNIQTGENKMTKSITDRNQNWISDLFLIELFFCLVYFFYFLII